MVKLLVEAINQLDLTVEATEAPLKGALNGLPLMGYADLLLRDKVGHPFVLDMKWSASARYRRQEVEDGTALQLATYAWMLRSAYATQDIHAGYFMLAQGQLISDSPLLGNDAVASAKTLAEIWDMSVASLDDVLTDLNKLAGRSVWVGDPKQAIYGFRGTDPQLMEEVVGLMKGSKVLKYSWRSRENLISFTNAVFSQVFHEMGADKVILEIPPERTEQAKGGILESWHLLVKNNPDEAAAIANGIRELIENTKDIRPGDIAVLCRTNAWCKDIATKLELLGVRASVGKGSLLDAHECQLAVSALRYMNNPGDTVALAELIKMSSTSGNWLADLMNDPVNTK